MVALILIPGPELQTFTLSLDPSVTACQPAELAGLNHLGSDSLASAVSVSSLFSPLTEEVEGEPQGLGHHAC